LLLVKSCSVSIGHTASRYTTTSEGVRDLADVDVHKNNNLYGVEINNEAKVERVGTNLIQK